ncbi:dTDP-glucose 4,6-dehydratase [Massilia terrae]|uniref:dTDP-glucose 4,6-dehydratase n=1 Tax=Massilia terrae TaxID=1811224 RepID=A0ABT2CZK0_9BURK|nr:dTDP-glucose 4,6-dehydratase [Massilia terrae]MCS0658508.1 dTDP-glucose 4,6-dehydratase [Massilia terrae]
MILVTGAAGFIGSNFVLDWLARSDEPVVNCDKLSYAGNLDNLAPLVGDARHVFVRADILDRAQMASLLRTYRPRAVIHFAAETHVDRSIHAPADFIANNVDGTFALLAETQAWWSTLGDTERASFRVLHVSTDEVFGSLGPGDAPFTEQSRYAPNSPYAASKAASDHLVRAWHHTYGLPTLVTNCSNNYGPFQFPEKLIPLMIANALSGAELPVYGDGRQVRDWLYVGDHCTALRRVLEAGTPGESYVIGGASEMTNLDVVRAVCDVLGELVPKEGGYHGQISHVADRPGHDRRYAIDFSKLAGELGWAPQESFAGGLRKTVQWYRDHADWTARVQSGAYREWIQRNYVGREVQP